MGGEGSGRKPVEDKRDNPVMFRLNDSEKADFDYLCHHLGLSQANCLKLLIKYSKILKPIGAVS